MEYSFEFLNLIIWQQPNTSNLPSFRGIIVPQIISSSYLLLKILLGSLYDFNFSKIITYLYLVCETKATVLYKFYILLIYEGLLNFHCFKPKLLITLWEPSRWVVVFFNSYLISVFFYLTVCHVYNYNAKTSVKNLNLSENTMFLYAYLDELDEELGQLEDIATYLIYFAVFILWFYFFNIFASAIIVKNIHGILGIFLFILSLGAVIPTKLLLNFGLAFSQYVRGSARSTKVFLEVILDFVAVSVIILRFFVQNVRFVFILVAFFEYYEFISNMHPTTSTSILPYISWDGYWRGEYRRWYWFEFVLQLFTQSVCYIYYVGHLTITYIAQLAIYIILSFWIFFFLYNTIVLDSYSKYFFFRRHVLMLK